MRLAHRIVLLAFSAPVAVAALSTSAASQPPPAPAPGPTQEVIGTVSAVNGRAHTFDVLTAVGHSFRVHRIVQPAGVSIEIRAGEPALPALYPGCVVRVQCSSAPTGAVASKIELLRTPPAAGRP